MSERELREDIKKLLLALADSKARDALLITKVCLSTGARWSEAKQLRPSQVRDGQIHSSNTKSGKNRSVPIGQALADELQIQNDKYGAGGRLFVYSYGGFRKAIMGFMAQASRY